MSDAPRLWLRLSMRDYARASSESFASLALRHDASFIDCTVALYTYFEIVSLAPIRTVVVAPTYATVYGLVVIRRADVETYRTLQHWMTHLTGQTARPMPDEVWREARFLEEDFIGAVLPFGDLT